MRKETAFDSEKEHQLRGTVVILMQELSPGIPTRWKRSEDAKTQGVFCLQLPG